jgi:hypothetical protein
MVHDNSNASTKIVRVKDLLDVEEGGVIEVSDGAEINVEDGGEINVKSGGTVNFESGAELQIAGVAITASAEDINAGTGAAQSVAGVVEAEKPTVPDSNIDMAGFRNHGAKNYNAGDSGDAGSVDIYPTTASKGKTQYLTDDNAGDTTTTIKTAAQAGARTYQTPDAGANADYVMTEGNQTIDGIKTFEDALRSSANTVTLGTGVTAVHEGDGVHMRSTFTLTAFAIGNSADNVALAVGAAFATLPAGVEAITLARMSVGVTIADANTAQTPELGIGNVVGSGANATLGAVGAGAENIIEGSAVADCAGTAEVVNQVPTAGKSLIINVGDAHALYLNVAATWADMDAVAALTADGTIVIDWVKLA